jgi:PKD repeat protein
MDTHGTFFRWRLSASRTLILALALLLALSLFSGLLGGPSTARADTAPPDVSLPTTVSSDPLPTVQIDGVVWSQVIVGNVVYVGGSFTTARPAGADPGTQTVPRSNFLAYDLTTGALLDSFAPSFNAQVRSIAVSPNGNTLYVGGQFTQVNGVNRYRVVAFNLLTGTVATSFAVTLNSSVYGVAASDTAVYLTGIFTSVNNVTRSGVAAVDATTGALLPFQVTPVGGTVRQVIVSPDKTKVVLGGAFTSMNGSSNPGYGLAMVDATTGAMLPLPLNALLRDGTSQASIMSLVATSTGFYGTGYSFSRAAGNVEGTFRSDWSGNMVWLEDCHGDTYSVAVSADAVYVAGHPHFCGSVGAFPQTPVWTFHRALAFTTAVTGVLGTDPWNYYNYAGQPAPTQLNWYPDINSGTYTGQDQGPWNVAANDNYVLYGGEFTTVNAKPQQGLVRFAKSAIAPNLDGPRLGGDVTGLTVRSYGSNALRIAWPANYDRDNEHLSYRVFRDDVFLYETSADSTFYRRPNLSFVDRTVTPSQTYTYKVKATDPYGNVMWSNGVTGAAGAGSALSRYQDLVLSDGPQEYWTLNETSGSTMTDLAGVDNGNKSSQVSQGVAGAIFGESGTAFRLSGSSSNSTMNSTVPQSSMDNFSTEAWFRTTSNRGGQIIGFDNSTAGGSSYADRHLYLSNTGQVNLAVKPNNVVKSLTSAPGYNNGAWHHVVGTLSGKGMTLYVDGVQVGFSADTKTGMQFATRNGYWKMGGDNLNGLPNRPTSNYLAGDLDEIAVYPVAISPAQVLSHYTLGATGVGPNLPPQAAFTASVSTLNATVDGSMSADSDGTIVSYAWDFGDSATATGPTASHAYAVAGTYQVTLVVTDDRGGTSTVTHPVTVAEAPNVPPVAAFTTTSTDLTLSVDGSTSTDSDGTIASYAWDFGDGATDVGAVTTHTYAVAGSYLVKLTVTDDDGAPNTLSQAVTVPTGVAPFALDEFNRSLATGLGTADVGGAWTTSGASGFGVSGGNGIYKLTSAGINRTAYLGGVSSASTDLRTSFTTDQPATGGGIYITVLGRRISTTADYRLNLRLTNANKVTVSLGALQGTATAVSLSSTVTLPGTYVVGSDVNVRMQVTGTNPTTVRAKVWLGTDAEPDGWTVSGTDSYVGLQAPGSPGLVGYLSGTSTTAPVNLAVHRIVATP